MTSDNRTEETGRSGSHWLPYVTAGLGLLVGLVVILLAPFPSPLLSNVVGGLLLALGTASVLWLIARNSGPGDRGPDF